ncbi:MAG: glycosyltransferase [Candidatus Roizmanbacteria bacterium]|nr:MAG: glycosyltransferase [Candidatus Roizmanbacteria bacterium]
METKKNTHFLSLIVPVYRQEKIIVDNLQSLKTVLDNIRYDYEIITVVDGFTDNSFKKIKKAKIDKVKCLGYEKNLGKSFAIRLGMKEAMGDYVMFIDSGMEIDPNGISMLLEHMEWYDADVIVGSKRHLASQVKYSLGRQILSHGYYTLVKLLFGLKIHDTQAGIKIFKKSVLQRILPRLVEKKFAGDLEMLVVADSLGFKRIYEAPIKLDYTLGNLTSAATIESIINILVDTIAIFYRKNILRYYSNPNARIIQPKNFKVVKFNVNS